VGLRNGFSSQSKYKVYSLSVIVLVDASLIASSLVDAETPGTAIVDTDNE
jgi:hypothetical protein